MVGVFDIQFMNVKKRNLMVFSLVPICYVASSVPGFIPGLFKGVGLAIPLVWKCTKPELAPGFASFDLEQLMASELVLSSVKWEEW